MPTDDQKQLWNDAECTSFDLQHRYVIVKFPTNTTRLSFQIIKTLAAQIAKLEEHICVDKPI